MNLEQTIIEPIDPVTLAPYTRPEGAAIPSLLIARMEEERAARNSHDTYVHDFQILLHNDFYGRTVGDFCDEVMDQFNH